MPREAPIGWARDMASEEAMTAAMARERVLVMRHVNRRTRITSPRVMAAALAFEVGAIMGTLEDGDPAEVLAILVKMMAEATASAQAKRRAREAH